jgi:transposase
MISAEIVARIRRLFYAEHWKVGTIAAEVGVHHDTVLRAIEAERFVNTGAQVRPTLLDAYKDFIIATLDEHPRLRATRIYEMVRDRGFPGSARQVRRYVATVRPAPRAEAYLRLDTLAGEQGQVDWGNFGKITVGHAQRSLSCFVLVLGYSRAVYARFALDQTLESFVRGHVEAFTALGGVPRNLLYDNLKSVVLERVADHIRFHPRVLEMAGHYHFAPRPCAPYRGNEKGKVERTISYLRHSFFAARRFVSIEDLNRQLARWIDEVAHVRKMPTDPSGRSVRDALEEERARLLPLPEHAFECDLVRPATSGKQPYVRFDGNDYSIPHTLVRKPLTLVASETLVRILDGADEVARHARTWDRGRVVEAQEHIAALARDKRAAHDLRGRDRLRGACPHADALLDALALRGEPLAGHTQRLGRLLDRYGAAELNAALADVIARGAISAASVAHVLDQRRRARRLPPRIEMAISADVCARDVSLTPHALGPYDALGRHDDDHSEGGDDDDSATR